MLAYGMALWLNRHSSIMLSGGTSCKEPACQYKRCKRCRFDPWAGKIPWIRKWQPAPVLLPGKSHGRKSLVGYNPWGRKESDTTKRLHFHFSLSVHIAPHWPFNSEAVSVLIDCCFQPSSALLEGAPGHVLWGASTTVAASPPQKPES